MTFCSNWRNEAELCLIPISCPRSPSSSSSEIISRSLTLWQLRRKYSEFPRVVHSFKFAGIWIWDSSESQICNHFFSSFFCQNSAYEPSLLPPLLKKFVLPAYYQNKPSQSGHSTSRGLLVFLGSSLSGVSTSEQNHWWLQLSCGVIAKLSISLHKILIKLLNDFIIYLSLYFPLYDCFLLFQFIMKC